MNEQSSGVKDSRLKRSAWRATASRLAIVAAAGALCLAPLAAFAAAGDQPSMPAQKAPEKTESPHLAWPEISKPKAGSPNVLLILTDDVGFASTSTFGGLIPTPNYDALAKKGARYNTFNTAAICSPTRAALLTGREPHSVNMGNVNNLSTGYEGYTSVIPDSAATVAEILQKQGYVTAALGKWHLTPEWEQSQVGPFDRWPTGEGFNYFYGFHGGDMDQFAPALFENTKPVSAPQSNPDYILDRDLADHAINWIAQQKALAPDHPFFMYLAPGTAHSPHSAPKDWLAKFRGKFDAGWDVARETIFQKQKARGIIPADAKLTPRPAFLPAWDSISLEKRRVYARMMEAYAAMIAFNDAQMGRVIDSLKASGQFENTLVIFIQGDNGSSAEGGPQGLFSEEAMINGYPESMDYIEKHLDEIGGPRAHNHFPTMWAWAMNTPFQYYKQVASHFGGTRNGMVVSWPGKVEKPSAIREQFLYVTDVAPTILEAAGITAPSELRDVKQAPMDGVSFADTFQNPKASPKRRMQVFETMQNVGIYRDGWMAGTRPVAAPWDITTKSIDQDLATRSWELYDVKNDFSEATDLAIKEPGKLEEMKALFYAEAAKYKILPVHGISDGAEGRPSLTEGRTDFVFPAGLTRVAENAAPRIIGRSFDITADIVVPPNGVSGVLVTQGGRFGGYSFYVKDNKPVFHYNMLGDRQYVIRADTFLSPGAHQLQARFKIDEPKQGEGGALTIFLDGKLVASGRIEHTHRTWISNSEGFDVGEDTLTPISDDYEVSDSKFTGGLKAVRIDLK